MPQYLSTDPNAGEPVQVTGGYLSTDPNAGQPEERAPDFRTETVGIVKDSPAAAVKGLIDWLNPFPAAKALVTAYAEMPDWEKAMLGPAGPLAPVVRGMGQAHLEQLRKGKKAFDEGRYSEMLGHVTAAGIPAIGPVVADVGEKYGEGRFWEATGNLLSLGVPAAVSRLRSVGVPAIARNRNPAERAAVQFGESRGIPVDAATASGNPAVRGTQFLADRSLGGSVVATRAARQTDDALTRVGNDLAGDINPQAGRPGVPVTGEQAGQAVRQGVTAKVQQFAGEANTAYDALRAIEAKATPQGVPMTQQGRIGGGTVNVTTVQPMRMAVDLRGNKAALQPIYERLKREADLVPLQGDKARALTTLDRLLNGPDFQPLSIVDEALSDLKAFTRAGRAGDMPQMRTAGQGAVAQAVKNLDAAVMRAAAKEGPQAVNALQKGRQATIAKYQADEVLQSLTDEPVRVFQQATWAKDAGIDRLRDVQKLAPEALPQLGRAFIEDLLATATAEGGFGRTQSIWAKWNNLGPETKRLLFGNPSNATNLDQFFLLAKKLQENPNPSGSAHSASLATQGVVLVTNPVMGVIGQLGAAGLSTLLHSPKAVRVLTQGLRASVNGNKAAAATAASEALAIAHELGVSMARVAETQEAPAPATAGR